MTLQTQPLLFTATDLLEMSLADLRDVWAERVTIIEYDGGLAHSVAEHAAWRWMRPYKLYGSSFCAAAPPGLSQPP